MREIVIPEIWCVVLHVKTMLDDTWKWLEIDPYAACSCHLMNRTVPLHETWNKAPPGNLLWRTKNADFHSSLDSCSSLLLIY
jgi:hypothetical protein